MKRGYLHYNREREFVSFPFWRGTVNSAGFFQIWFEVKEGDWHSKKQSLFWKAGWPLFMASIHNRFLATTTELSGPNLFDAVTLSIARGWDHPFGLQVSFEFRVFPHTGHMSVPHIQLGSLWRPTLFAVTDGEAAPCGPKSCFQIWSPKGNLTKLLQACFNTDPFSQLHLF